MSERETYLGDCLYASWDGWQVRLRAPRENGDHEVFLEDGLTLQAFFEFLDTSPHKKTELIEPDVHKARRFTPAGLFLAGRSVGADTVAGATSQRICVANMHR